MNEENTTTRERLVGAMLEALRRKGYHGVGLTELLSAAQAPKGVLYHHFPGGKAELAVAAIDAVVDQLTTGLDKLMRKTPDPVHALEAWMGGAQKLLAGSGYERGCPLATIALESTPQDIAMREALAKGFASIRDSLRSNFASAGMQPEMAASVAALIVSAYEGALLQARVAGSTVAMQSTTQALVHLVRSCLPKPNQSKD